MVDHTEHDPGPGDRRPIRWDEWRVAGMKGAAFGTDGLRLPLLAWLAVGALLALVVFVNVATQLDDAHHRGASMALSHALVLEGSSALAAMLAFPLVVIALTLAPPQRGIGPRLIATHLVASLLFSALHITLMTGIRMAVMPMVGGSYHWRWIEPGYEYRKDLLTYVIMAGLYWGVRQLAPKPRADRALATFDIRDGTTVLRVATGDILAVQAAGNYVEFLLADGRKPLMRAALAEVAAALKPSGFLRTHRSWLVNPARMQALTATGSGDFTLDLGSGVIAPVSRRHREALARLRDGDLKPSSASASP